MEISAYDGRQRRKYLNREEGSRFLLAVMPEPERRRLFCFVLYYSGCRISEALELSSEQVDSADGVLRIRSLKKRQTQKYRRVPIPAWLKDDLLSLSSPSPTARIFSFSRSTGWRVVKEVMKEAALTGPKSSPKGLRHGFGVRCAMAKTPRNLIQKWMGHSDPNTTSIYLDIIDEEEREFIAKTWETGP